MILNVVVLFFFVFCVQFKGIPLSSSKWIVVALALFSVIRSSNNWTSFITSSLIRKSFVFFILLIFFGFFFPFFYGTDDYSVAYGSVLFFVEDFIGSYLVLIFLNRNGKFSEKMFFETYSWVALIQSLIVIGMLVFPDLRMLIWNAQEADFSQISERYEGIRGMGMAASVTYDLGVVLSIALIFVAYNMSERDYENIKLDLCKYAVIVIGIALTGRTGYFGLLLSIIYLFVDFIRKNNLKILGKGFVSIILGVVILNLAYDKFIPMDVRDDVEAYALESYVNYEETGEFKSTSGTHLQQMYFPIPLKTFLLGDGLYTENGAYYMHTDAGYMRNVLFWGVFPSLLLYALYFFWTKEIVVRVRFVSEKNIAFIAVLLLSLFLITNYKGDFMLGCRMATKIFILFTFVSVFYRKK